MRDKKYYIALDDFERRVVVKGTLKRFLQTFPQAAKDSRKYI